MLCCLSLLRWSACKPHQQGAAARPSNRNWLCARHRPASCCRPPLPDAPCRSGVRPNVTTYNCLIAAASDAGAYPALHQVGEWLDGADMEIRASCINAFVSGLVKVRGGAAGACGMADCQADSAPSACTS